MNEIVINPLDADEQKQYTSDTAFSPTVEFDVETTEYDTQSIPIDEELAKQLVHAVKSRVEATKKYTEDRIQIVNDNIQRYESSKNETNADYKLFVGETFLAVNKWIDELCLKFEKFSDSIEIKDPQNQTDAYVIKMLQMEPKEEKSIKSYMDYFLQYIQENTPRDQETSTDNQNERKKYAYYFRRGDILKSFIKEGLKRSKFDKMVEELFFWGVNSGLFVFKLWPKQNDCYSITKLDSGYESKPQNDTYLAFIPKDPRRLIFPRTGLDDWVIEKSTLSFSDILAVVTDSNGEFIDDAEYDISQIKNVQTYLKNINRSTVSDKRDEYSNTSQVTDDKEIELLDGKVDIYEAHCVPIRIPKKYSPTRSEQTLKCIVTCVCFDNQNYYPIGCRLYPHDEPQFYSTYFDKKENDCAGHGLPKIIYEIQKALNDLYSLKMDYIRYALYGTTLASDNIINDLDQLKSIQPHTIIPVNVQEGLRIQDHIIQFRPEVAVLTYADVMINQLLDVMQRLSRKGPNENKIAPNPTATEATNIYAQQEKSIMRAALRLNDVFLKMLTTIYVYYLNQIDSNTTIKTQGIKVLEVKNQAPDKLESPAQIRNIEKYIPITAEEVFIPEYEFTVKAIEDSEQQAVERQQFMQFLSLMDKLGAFDPKTGTARQFSDEMGKPVQIDFYSLLCKAAKQYGMTQDEIWKEIDTENNQQQSLSQLLQQQPSQQPPQQQAPESPNMQESTPPNMADMLAGSHNAGL